jgi:hypothetical protein
VRVATLYPRFRSEASRRPDLSQWEGDLAGTPLLRSDAFANVVKWAKSIGYNTVWDQSGCKLFRSGLPPILVPRVTLLGDSRPAARHLLQVLTLLEESGGAAESSSTIR